ncbi:MAG: TIGR01212 family radical SAM protein, partial [Treponema sp.]|nr:TIGR01212 family radical SAM protein [Treponema sp.]
GESSDDMLESVRQLVEAGSHGIKITCLYILEGTDLAKDFKAGKFKALEMDEYFCLLEQALKILPSSMVIHRLTGDPPKRLLIEPKWTMNKKVVLNRMNKLLRDAGV